MNRRLAFATLILAFTLGACIPGVSPISMGDQNATAMALAGTLAAQTVAAQPTATLAPTDTPSPTSTATATQTATPTITHTPTETATNTPDGTGTTTETATPTATGSPATDTATTATASRTATPTLSPTPGVLLYGTVPPEVPYGRVHLVNLTNQMVYISFHCKLENGLISYLEYPVYGKITVSIPAGPCHYVAWVKGEQITGDVRIKKRMEYTFTFKKHKVIITQP